MNALTNTDFKERRALILANWDASHELIGRDPVFNGPSLYFHRMAVDAARKRDLEQFAQQVYGALVSWGMHRPGRKGSKMRPYEEFSESIRAIWPTVLLLQDKKPNNLVEADWERLRNIFMSIRCMASETSLVGNSKVMAHALSNLVAPIDREYTLTFLHGNNRIVNNKELEWDTLRRIHQGFFYPILESAAFKKKYSVWVKGGELSQWDTSPLKVIDNLVIGTIRIGAGRRAPSKRRVPVLSTLSRRVARHEKRSKYDALKEFLNQQDNQKVTLQFSEAPKILGFELPSSATKYQAFWANQTNTALRPWAKAWRDAGFRVESYRLDDKDGWVRFERDDKN